MRGVRGSVPINWNKNIDGVQHRGSRVARTAGVLPFRPAGAILPEAPANRCKTPMMRTGLNPQMKISDFYTLMFCPCPSFFVQPFRHRHNAAFFAQQSYPMKIIYDVRFNVILSLNSCSYYLRFTGVCFFSHAFGLVH